MIAKLFGSLSTGMKLGIHPGHCVTQLSMKSGIFMNILPTHFCHRSIESLVDVGRHRILSLPYPLLFSRLQTNTQCV